MRPLFSAGGREVLGTFARSDILLGFDFDGTLAPIVARPERATLPGSTRRLLRILSGLYPWVVVSGRSRADVARRMEGTGVTAVYGNHGLESGDADDPPEQVARWRQELERRLAGRRGVFVEDKGYSLAVHYRASRTAEVARAAIVDAATHLAGARVIGGKAVVNLLPEGGRTKGTAFLRARSAAGCDTALYVGDDDTDEDVFALEQPGRLLTIRVGHSDHSRAMYFLPRQADVDALLRALIAARATPDPEHP